MTFYCNKCKKYFSDDSPICPFCGYGEKNDNSIPDREFEVLATETEDSCSDPPVNQPIRKDSVDSKYRNHTKASPNKIHREPLISSNPESERTYGIIILVSGAISFGVALLGFIFFLSFMGLIISFFSLIISIFALIIASKYKRSFGRMNGLSKLGKLLNIVSLVIIGIQVILHVLFTFALRTMFT